MKNRKLWMDLKHHEILEQAGNETQYINSIQNVTNLIEKMRTVKDDKEIELIRKSAEIGAKGLCEMMKAAEPGMNEKNLNLILDFNFKKLGSTAYSFQTQAASGPNSTLVHYGLNNRKTEPGDMMVFDIGPEYEYYTCDISRSFPISGKFNKEQREALGLSVGMAQKTARIMLGSRQSLER